MSVSPAICSDPDCTICQHLNGRAPTLCPRTTVWCQECERSVPSRSLESLHGKKILPDARYVRLMLDCGHRQRHVLTLANLHLIALTRAGARI